MHAIQAGQCTLRKAEHSLRQLLAEAATTGDYEGVLVLSRWAQGVATLLNLDEPSPPAPTSRADIGRNPSGNRKRVRAKSRRSTGAGYPKFVRDEDCLVKIGWSKKDRGEYEHKAPKQAVQAVVSSLSRAGRDGARFSMETVLPLTNLDGSPIPDYQSYLILAWLRSIKLVMQHGRVGYTIPGNVELVNAVEDCWNRLARRTYTVVNPTRAD